MDHAARYNPSHYLNFAEFAFKGARRRGVRTGPKVRSLGGEYAMGVSIVGSSKMLMGVQIGWASYMRRLLQPGWQNVDDLLSGWKLIKLQVISY